ncbi:hypothetical protein KY348_03870 [Candidatus Woesearchaeota archaeon]|nr:hypothetical protein [Candidatus Woesearchaeota archaeon]
MKMINDAKKPKREFSFFSPAILITFYTLFIFFLLNLAFVSGIGVSPAGKTINFQPNTNVELKFNIINSEQNTFEARLMVIGELAPIIFFEKDIVNVNASDYRTPFKTIIKFPSEMEPGIHKGMIEINPELPGVGDKMFAAYIAPQIPVSVRVPYPSKYADIRLAVLDVDEGTPVPIYIEFDNFGSEDILRAGAQVEVYSPEQELIATLSTPEVSIKKGSMKKAQAQPSPILRKGLYSAVVKAQYDNIDKVIRTNFTIKEPVVRIKKLLTKELAQNQINKVVFEAYNEWNTELAIGGFIEIDEKKSEMPVFELGMNEKKEITGFFDTTGLALGEYNMSIALVYAGQIKTDTFLVKISKKIKILEKPVGIWPLILVITIIIIVILVIVLLVIKKRKPARERNL